MAGLGQDDFKRRTSLEPPKPINLQQALVAAIPEAAERMKIYKEFGSIAEIRELFEQAMELEENPVPLFRESLLAYQLWSEEPAKVSPACRKFLA